MKFKTILFLAFVAVLTISLEHPFAQENDLLTNILGVSTFLFGVFIAFSMSDRQKRIDEIRENDSLERGSLESIHKLAPIYGKEKALKITDKIDGYLMSTLDYKIWDFAKTENSFQELAHEVVSIETKTEQQTAAYPLILELVTNISNGRKQTIGLIKDRLSMFEWSVFILLSLLIIVPLLLINDGTALSVGISLVLSISVLMVLTLLHKLDTLTWKERARIFEPYQDTLGVIGRLPYYPDPLIVSRRARVPKGISYRIASYPNPYPNMAGKIVTIVKP